MGGDRTPEALHPGGLQHQEGGRYVSPQAFTAVIYVFASDFAEPKTWAMCPISAKLGLMVPQPKKKKSKRRALLGLIG